MVLGISYEVALEHAKKNAFGEILSFEYGPVRYLNYRDLSKDEFIVDEAGMHNSCGDVELLFVDDKLVFSFLEVFRDRDRSRNTLMGMNYATKILYSAVWCFKDARLEEDETIDDEIKKTAKWLDARVEFLRELVADYFMDYVAEGERHWDLINAHKYLNVQRDINDSILNVLIDKERGEEESEK